MPAADVPAVVATPEELLGCTGRRLGPTDWRQVTQAHIDAFALATGDHQWIHVDASRAAAGPFGATIAHGYLTSSLAGVFVPELICVTSASQVLNYGSDRVRYLSPVVVGSWLRAVGEIEAVRAVPDGMQVTLDLTIESRDQAKPACVVRSIVRYQF
jgi:acyl dehydratase